LTSDEYFQTHFEDNSEAISLEGGDEVQYWQETYTDITLTEEYQHAESTGATCPVPWSFFDIQLSALQWVCSSSISDTDPTAFCNRCVRPAHNLLLNAYMDTKSADELSDTSFDADMKRLAEQDECGKKAVDSLFKHSAVSARTIEQIENCMTEVDKQPACPDQDVIERKIKPLRQPCFSSLQLLHADVNDNSSADSWVVKNYCSTCYWPLVSEVVKEVMPSNFWCMKSKSNDPSSSIQGRSFLSDDMARVAKAMNEHEPLVGCVDAARTFLIGAQSADAEGQVDPLAESLTDKFDLCWTEDLVQESFTWTCQS